MAKVTIDSSGRYVSRRQHDQTESQPEAVPMEERNLPAGDMAMPEVQSGKQKEIQNVPEVRGEE
jgi:hypothetical protein